MIVQRQIKGFPPNYIALKKAFPAINQNTIFSYGEVVYVPSGNKLSREIAAHEAVHGERQLDIGVTFWWDRYLDDADFRYVEELVAHRAEFLAFKNGIPMPGSRATRAALAHIAGKFCGPLYNNMCSFEQAVELIRG